MPTATPLLEIKIFPTPAERTTNFSQHNLQPSVGAEFGFPCFCYRQQWTSRVEPNDLIDAINASPANDAHYFAKIFVREVSSDTCVGAIDWIWNIDGRRRYVWSKHNERR